MSPVQLRAKMKSHTYIPFLVAAALFALNGARGLASGDAQRTASGLAMAAFWVVLAAGIKRRQQKRGA